MSAFGCLEQVLTKSNIPTQVLFAIWCIVTVLAWILSFSFIFFVWAKLSYEKSQGTKRSVAAFKKQRVFALGVAVTNFIIVLHMTTELGSCLFYVHLFTPSLDIDYINDLNECNYDTYNFYTVLSNIFGPPSAALYDLSFMLVLSSYYYRLLTLFNNSICQLSRIKSIIFAVLMLIFIIISILRNYYQVIGDMDIFVPLFNSFLSMYFVISVFLVIVLKQQSDKLLSFLTRNVNIPSDEPATPNVDGNAIAVPRIEMRSDYAELVARLRPLAKAFSKLTLLAYVCIISSVVVIITSVLAFQVFIEELYGATYGYVPNLIYWTLIFCDNLVNIACISFQFEFIQNRYFGKIYKHICRPCMCKCMIITIAGDAGDKRKHPLEIQDEIKNKIALRVESIETTQVTHTRTPTDVEMTPSVETGAIN